MYSCRDICFFFFERQGLECSLAQKPSTDLFSHSLPMRCRMMISMTCSLFSVLLFSLCFSFYLVSLCLFIFFLFARARISAFIFVCAFSNSAGSVLTLVLSVYDCQIGEPALKKLRIPEKQRKPHEKKKWESSSTS